MNTNMINSIVTNWASETDGRLKVALAWASSNWEFMPQTQVTLQIRDELTGNKPCLGMQIPHARRTAFYFYGPNGDDLVEEDFHFPSFEDEAGLRIALNIVYRRFMTEHGMQRFDDSAEKIPEFYRPNLVEKAEVWVLQKDSPKYSLRELAPSTGGLREGGIELHPTGKNPSGLFIRINNDRSQPQHYIYDKQGKFLNGHIPAFFTESELRGALEYASRHIDGVNKNIQKNKSKK
jgi:hypothetical protein